MSFFQGYYSSSGIGFIVLDPSFAPLRRPNTIFSDLADFSTENVSAYFFTFGIHFTALSDRNTKHHYFYHEICLTDLPFYNFYIPHYLTSCSTEGVNFVAVTQDNTFEAFFLTSG